MAPKKSFVWLHFASVSKKEVVCNICHAVLARVDQSTTSMATHLRTQHNIVPGDDGTASVSAGGSGTQKRAAAFGTPSVNKFFKAQESLSEYLAKWTAKNNFTVAGIIGCAELSKFLATRNMSMPKSRETVWKHVEKFYEEKFGEQTKKIEAKVAKKVKFSISLDEWTDNTMKRYLKLFLHDHEEVFSLGLVPIPKGHCTSEVLEVIVRERLQLVGVDLSSSVVASTSDGDTTVKKLAELLQLPKQLCVNHGIHLAVTDVVYKKTNKKTSTIQNQQKQAAGE